MASTNTSTTTTPRRRLQAYQVTVDRTTVYEVQATSEEEAIDAMMRGEAIEEDTETTDMRVQLLTPQG